MFDSMGRAIGGSAATQARIDAAPGLSRADAHALAGFIAAEGCFIIGRNNGGRDWICVLRVSQRADDGHVLEDICRGVGLGGVSELPPQGNSWPLACWTVSGKLDCRELARLLRKVPLRGRKQHEFDLWAEAVDLWSERLYDAGRDASVDARMGHLREQLLQSRRYVDPPSSSSRLESGAPNELVWFLGGFFSGEGCFLLSPTHAQAVINMRADERSLLEQFRGGMGLGRIYQSRPGPPCNPAARWTVGRQSELASLIEVLDRAILRGRKRREFEAWRVGAEEFIAARRAGRKRDLQRIEQAMQALREARRFIPMPPAEPVDAATHYRAARSAYSDVLREWACSVEGPLSCVDYQRARRAHPDWPQRNTIAAAFGGWAEALVASGLGARRTPRSISRGYSRANSNTSGTPVSNQ
jgi:hypothetical protein